MTFVIVGGSAGLGRALARRFAAAGHDLILVSSDERDVNAMAADLSIRYRGRVIPVAADVSKIPEYLERLNCAVREVGGIDGLLFPVGAVLDDDEGNLGPAETAWLTAVNFSSVAATVSAFLPGLQSRPSSCIVGFGSIAAVRGRGRNVVYSAAKRALASFFESLRHQCAGTHVAIQFYVLGYIDTTLTFGRQLRLPRGDPDALSELVLRNLGRDAGVIYYPRFWRVACAALWMLPWPFFKRLSL